MAPHLVTIDMSMAACRDALDNTSAQDMWAAHCSEYLFISTEKRYDLLMSDHKFLDPVGSLVSTLLISGLLSHFF